MVIIIKIPIQHNC